MPDQIRFSPRTKLMAAAIFLLAFLTFLPALGNDFVSLDDSLYVYQNSLVQGDVTPAGIARAFAGPECNFYHPLTMLSLMLDHQIWGLRPGGYHLTNILFHAGSAALLFLVLVAMTGAEGRSAFVAAMFAVHPLRVESVAWVAERKDVLSVFCFLLTVAVYVHYTRRPESRGRATLVVVLFAVGLLCKVSIVTLPAVLLLLDYWPLGRLKPGSAGQLLREKIPLFVLAMIASGVAVGAEKTRVIPFDDYPFLSRLGNAVVTYPTYIFQTFVPTGLAAFYPFSAAAFTPGRIVLSLLFLIAITGWSVAWARKKPYFFVGWFWYLGLLVPMLGLVQEGAFARADRFTYLAQIGLLVVLAWGATDFTKDWKFRPGILTGSAAALLVACVIISVRQIGFWSDSETLFRHALAVTHDNGLAEDSLGIAILEKRRHGPVEAGDVTPMRKEEAISHLRNAVRLLPDHADAHLNLGLTLAGTGARDEAIEQLQIAIRTMSFHARGQLMLGLLLAEKGESAEALPHLEAAVQLDPANLSARNNLGALLRHLGRTDEAIEQYRIALRQNPNFADGHNNLGIALYQRGQKTEAVREFQEALRYDPGNAQARQNLRAASN